MTGSLSKKIKFKNTSNKKNDIKWVVTIIVWTFVISVAINYSSSSVLPKLDVFQAFLLLFVLVMTGVVFDIIGIAVATATEVPFHSMASKHVKGAKQAIGLVGSADKVSNFCNDVVGDIVGIISGGTAAIIVAEISSGGANSTVLSLVITAAVAALTVGGKAFGKGLAMRRANAIVYKVAVLIYYKDKVFGKKTK